MIGRTAVVEKIFPLQEWINVYQLYSTLLDDTEIKIELQKLQVVLKAIRHGLTSRNKPCISQRSRLGKLEFVNELRTKITGSLEHNYSRIH